MQKLTVFANTPINEEVRLNHEKCQDTKERLYIKRTSKGWVYNCFNCGWSGFKPNKQGISLEETRRKLNSETKVANADRSIKLPYDFTADTPAMGRTWLDKYAITEDEIRRYRFGYSEKLNRLILPLYNREGDLIFWQGRNLGKPTKESPKYLNVRSGKDNVVVFSDADADSTKICLVEDILSAIKVSRSVHAIPLLGSFVSNKVIQAVSSYPEILVFLDYDKRLTSLKATNRIRLLTGRPCRSIITLKDPKECTDLEIKELIYGRG